ncbi:quinone oxidoreductase [Oceanobacillus caeni]|uniref:quinone oxidoreductase family protein n=1 Tax=Oceanobacillus caeni TaxID=405946 RepID=UPI001C242CEA|nr:quinone oxidoreductase [Oceanobacillus caeni]MBU8789291.1 quinone oxidoreductase [Oceanobacillus caeni]
MKVVQFKEYGGPEVLKLIELDLPNIGETEVLIKIKAIGVNYADTARREGAYVVPTPLPFIPGLEIAGEIVGMGEKVKGVKKGDRVMALIESGGYADYAIVKANQLIPIPDGVAFEHAVAIPVQGLSAYHILKTMGRLKEGETVLIHAAAGGVGVLAVQLAKIFGAGRIIATASTPEKLELAKEMGADDLVNYMEEGWENKVREITGGKGVDVALEMVGGDVFHKTVNCLAPFGRLVIYGVASGNMPKFYPSKLMKRNQSIIGFFLSQIMKEPDLYLFSLKELISFVEQGKIKTTIGGTYPLEEVAHVHQILQSRKTKGKIILIP